MKHILKIKDKYFEKILSGLKPWEIRKNDRNYQVGDLIHFVDVNGNEFKDIIYSKNIYKVIYILDSFPEGLKDEYIIFSLKKVN